MPEIEGHGELSPVVLDERKAAPEAAPRPPHHLAVAFLLGVAATLIPVAITSLVFAPRSAQDLPIPGWWRALAALPYGIAAVIVGLRVRAWPGLVAVAVTCALADRLVTFLAIGLRLPGMPEPLSPSDWPISVLIMIALWAIEIGLVWLSRDQIMRMRAASPDPRTGMSIAQAIGLCLWSLVFTVLVFGILSLTLSGLRREMGFLTRFVVAQAFAWPLGIGLGIRWTGLTLFPKFDVKSALAVRVILPLVLASVGLSILLFPLASLIPMPESVQASLIEGLSTASGPVLLIAVVILAPVGEEIFFRGIVFRALAERYSLRRAILASALLFAVYHGNPWQASAALPLGVALGGLMSRTGSVVPGIIGHAAYNLSVVFVVPSVFHLGDRLERPTPSNSFPFLVVLVGTIATAVGAAIIFRLTSPTANGVSDGELVDSAVSPTAPNH